MYVHKYVRECVRVCVCEGVCVCMCVRVCVYVHVCILVTGSVIIITHFPQYNNYNQVVGYLSSLLKHARLLVA